MKTILQNLKTLISGRSQSSSAGGSATVGASRAIVVDPGSGAKGRDRFSPGAQVKVLERLSRFVEREKVKVTVVLDGKDLRAVQHGGEFRGVTVFFTQGEKGMTTILGEALHAGPRSSGVTVVTDDPEMEKAGLAAGATAMRMTTFEKAVDGGIRRGSGGNAGVRSGRSSRGGQRNRRRRSSEEQPRMSRQGGSDKDPVRDLLDLVD